ncbi:MAG: hypothetical protein IMZ69_11790, partial [Spirochaetes bacterium]|nr:hypothetical protein [Spirochaetota bacterium]
NVVRGKVVKAEGEWIFHCESSQWWVKDRPMKERSHGIHRYYEITLIHDQHSISEVRWDSSRAAEADARDAGRYYIRTSRTDLDEKSLWQLYVTLGGIEDSLLS